MQSLDLWLVSFGLRCGALVAGELACFLYILPTLFNLHSDLANAGAAVLAVVVLVGGTLWGIALTREVTALVTPPSDVDQ